MNSPHESAPLVFGSTPAQSEWLAPTSVPGQAPNDFDSAWGIPQAPASIAPQYSQSGASYASEFGSSNNSEWSVAASAYGQQPTAAKSEWGSPAAHPVSADTSAWNDEWAVPTTEVARQPVTGNQLRQMFDDANAGEGQTTDRLSRVYDRLPEPAKQVARGAGAGALEGVLDQYTKQTADGGRKLKKTAVLRAAMNPTGAARRAATGAVKGARSGALEASQQIAQDTTGLNANQLSSAANIAGKIGRSRFGRR